MRTHCIELKNAFACRRFPAGSGMAILIAAGILAGCASRPESPVAQPAAKASRAERRAEAEASAERLSNAGTVDAYKRELALRISDMNAAKVYDGRPQALLRSVVVLRYAVDARGNLVKSEIMRSNRDRETESTAMAALRNSAPFPKPSPHLLRRGQLELAETWLFNSDGRFQLRTIAQPQMSE